MYVSVLMFFNSSFAYAKPQDMESHVKYFWYLIVLTVLTNLSAWHAQYVSSSIEKVQKFRNFSIGAMPE